MYATKPVQQNAYGLISVSLPISLQQDPTQKKIQNQV